MIAVIGFGAGGHAKVVIEILRLVSEFEVVGLLDPNAELHATDVLGVPVLGDDSLAATLAARGIRHAFVGVGSSASTCLRRRVFDRARGLGFHIISAVHPSAVVSPSAVVGAGATIMAGAVVNAAAIFGVDVTVNTGALVEHDCRLGDHVHVATGARLAGGVTVADGAHVGIGATIRQGVSIGSRSVVGAGAVVIDDVPERVVVVGVPARVLRRVEDE